MPLAKPLPELQRELELQLAEGNEYLPAILKQLQELLPVGSEKRNTAITMLARLNDANKKALRQTISDEDLQIEYNAIRADLLDFIHRLTETDFDEATASKVSADGEPAPKQGNVLYRIPRKMPMQKETECVVRIAISEDAIVENITLDQSVVLKDLKRVSDVMQVELADPAKEPVFNIRTTSEAQQLITDEGYTEWFFYVEPMQAGVFPLEIKVAVLEMALNNVYRKEIVFRETIEILTEGTPPEVAGSEFKKAGAVLNFQSPPLPGAPQGAPLDSPTAAPQGERSAMSKAGGFLATAAIAAIGYVAFFQPQIPDWYWAKYVEKTEAAYTDHISKFPNSPYREEAFCRRAEMVATLAIYREYLRTFPNGKCEDEIEQALKELENKQLEEIRQNPTEQNIIGFINDFPDSRRMDELMKIAQSKPELKKDVWAKFEDIYWEALQKTPTVPTVRTFLKTFPDTRRLPDLKHMAEADTTLKKETWRDIENAWIGLLEKEHNLPSIRRFLAEFPDSERLSELKHLADSTTQLHPEDKVVAMAEIETTFLQSIQREPNAPKILEFLIVFPESNRLLELKHLVDSLPKVQSDVMPVLENIFWQKLAAKPDVAKIGEFLREFPAQQTPRLLELRKIVEKNRQFKKEFLPEIKNRIAALQPKRPSVSSRSTTTGTLPADQPEPQPAAPPVVTPPAADVLPKPPKPSMVWVQGGIFDMGCTDDQGAHCGDKAEEKPVFDIKIGSYWLGKHEVTFDEFDLFCEHTGHTKPNDHGWGRGSRPVINVSWFDAVKYCNWLSQQHGLAPAYTDNYALRPSSNGYRLPTEAEWEYAARGGSKSQGYQFAGSDNLDEVAWHQTNAGSRTRPVGTKKGNELRLDDMSGNVLEWCHDWFAPYVSDRANNPRGPANGTERVLRSSSWTGNKNQNYVAVRRHNPPDNNNDYIGFRLARN